MISEVAAAAAEVKSAKEGVVESKEAINNPIESLKKTELPVSRFDSINQHLDGKEHEKTGVPFVHKQIELPDGKKVEGVFPQFDSAFDAKLEESQYLDSDARQFKEANKQLKEAVDENPNLRDQFSPEQLEQIEAGDTPEGYVWHHSEEPGELQLVDQEIHEKTGHTGGRSIWGGGTDHR
jgi:hypothetical protein